MPDFIKEQLKSVDPNTGLTLDTKSVTPIMAPTYSPKGYEQNVPLPDIKFSAIEGMPKGEDPYMYAGEHQSNWAKLGGFLNQAAVGEIAGGTVEGLGYLMDLEQTASIIEGTEKEFSNWFSDLGKDLKTWTQEATPIYTDYKEGSFSPGHVSWWLKNGTSVASTLSLLIPAAGTVRAVGVLGKALGISGKMGKSTKFLATGLGQAVASRHMENIMEASQVYDSVYNDALTKGLTDEQAKEAAAKGAQATYTADWAMLSQDIPQYLFLGKAFGKASLDNTVATAKALGKDITPIIAKKAKGYLLDAASEGAEEAFQYVTSKEAEYLARKGWDKEQLDEDFGSRMDKYVNSGELWTNFVFGALGSGVFQTAGKLVNDAINKTKGIATEEDRRLADIKSWAPQINYWNERLKEAQQYGDVHSEVRAESELWSTLAAKAAYNGNIDNVKDFLAKASSTTEDQAAEFGFSQEAIKGFREQFPKAIKKFDEAAKLYNTFVKDYTPEQSAELTRQQLSLQSLNELRNKVQQDFTTAEANIVNFSRLSPTEQQVRLKRIEIAGTENLIKQMTNWLDTRKLDDAGKASVQERIASLKGKVKSMQVEIPTLLATKTKDQIKSDSEIRLDMTKLDEAYKLAGKKIAIEEAINSTIDSIDKIKNTKKSKIKEDELRKQDETKTEEQAETEEVTPANETSVQPEEEIPFEAQQQESASNPVPVEEVREDNPSAARVNQVLKGTSIDTVLTKSTDKLEVEYKGEPGYIYNKEGKIRFRSEKIDVAVADVRSKQTLAQLGLNPMKDTVTDINITEDGNMFIVNGTSLTLIKPERPLTAINHDADGNPISVTVLDQNGNIHKYTNKILVTDLAYTIRLQELVKQRVLKFITDNNATFVYVKDNFDPKIEHKVYFANSNYIIEKTEGTPITKTDIFGTFSTELSNIINKLSEYKKSNPEATDKDLKDEARRSLQTLRSPDARETNTEKSAGEIPVPVSESRQTEQVPEATTEETKASESEILRGSAVPKSTTPDLAEPNPDAIDTDEPLSVSETHDPKKDQTLIAQQTQRAASPQDNIAYSYFDRSTNSYVVKNQQFENFISNPNNTLKDATFEFYLAKDEYNPVLVKYWGKEGRKLNELLISKGKLSEPEIDSILELKTANYENLVDTIPIGIKVKVGDHEFHDGLFYHTASFGSVESEKQAVRQYRQRIVRELLSGNKVIVKGAEKFPGVINNSGGNKSLNDVRGIDTTRLTLGIADRLGNITNSEQFLMGIGSHGNVYFETDVSCNGDKRLVKLNVAKISQEHAEIIWEAFSVWAKTGYKTIFKHPATDPVTVKTIVNSLVFNGPDTMEYRSPNLYPDLHLADKTLFLELKKDGTIATLHYGRASSINMNKPSAQDRIDFINWVKANKNYIVYRNNLGQVNKRDYKIGSFLFKAGDSYNKSLVDNKIVTTDLDRFKPFTRPVVKMNMSTLAVTKTTTTSAAEVIVPKQIGARVENDIAFDENNKIVYSNKPIPIKSNSKLWLLPVGSIIKLPGSEYLEIKGTDTAKILSVHSTDPDLVKFDRISVSEANSQKLASLLTDISFMRLEATLKPIPKGFGEVKIAEPDLPKVEEEGDLMDDVSEFKPSPIDDSPFKESTWDDELFGREAPASKTYTKANIDKELKWLKSKLGKIPVNLSNRLLYIASKGKTAHGVFSRDAITLYTGAEEGTAYHEAFHRVSLMYLTNAERNGIYSEAKRKFNMAKATDVEIEEKLAEEFRVFILNSIDEEKNRTLPQKIATWFKQLYDYIFTFFVRKPVSNLDMDKLFRNIKKGTYKNVAYLTENYNSLGSNVYLLEVKGTTLENFSNLYELNLMAKTLMFFAFKNCNITSVRDLKQLDLDKVLPSIDERITKYQRLLEVEPERADKINSLIYMWQEVKDKFPNFKNYINDQLAALKVKQTEDPENEDEKVDNGNEEHEKSSYEFDSKDNAAASVKLMVSTLPSEEGVDAALDLPIFTDFAVAWSSLMRDLSGTETYTEMKSIVDSKAKSNMMYRGLAARLNAADENVRTQFFVTFSKHKHKFLNITYEIVGGKPSFSVLNADLNKARSAYVSEWGMSFIQTDLFDDASSPNKEKIIELIDRYSTLQKDLKRQIDKTGEIANIEEVKSTVVDLVKSVGIPYDIEQLNYILNDYKDLPSVALYKFIGLPTPQKPSLISIFGEGYGILPNILAGKGRKRKDGSVYPYQNMFSDEKTVRRMAEVYGILFPSRIDDSVLGAGGNQYYVYSLNNYLTDFARLISKDIKDSNGVSMLDKLRSVRYNTNSIWLKELTENTTARNRFAINTFSGLMKMRAGDSGKDYSQMTEEEKYLLNMAFILNGYYPLPTVADKKSYFVIQGPSILDAEFSTKEQKKLVFPEEVTKVFYGYFMDEYKRIIKTKQDLVKYVETGNESDLIRYYHKNKTKADGNALQFQLFSEARLNNETGKVDFNISGNKYSVDPNNYASVEPVIRRILANRLQDELVRAEKYKLITLQKQGQGFRYPSGNLLLDGSLINKYTEALGSEVNAVTQVIFKYMVNQMVSTIETYKLLSGDPAFYKGKGGNVDALFTELGKRLPELTSTGDRLRLDWPEGHELVNKSTYTVSSINDNVLESTFYDSLYNYHYDLYKKFFTELGYDNVDKLAENKAKTKLKNYKEVNQTDAQVYISPSFYRELRIRLGEWSDQHQAAYDKLMSDAVLSAKEENEMAELVMQPLKMLHYGPTFYNGLGIPVYDKMSLATLFPRTIKAINPTADLAKLFERMLSKDKPIDMIKFESAVKVGNVSGISFYKDKENKETIDFSTNDLPISNQEIRNLRRQLITDPHDAVRRNAGTQFRKISLSNVRKDNKYSLPSGEVLGTELLDIWKETSSEISNRGKDKILKKLGYDATGKVNNKAFVDILYNAAKDSNMHDDLLQALKLDEHGEQFMQIDALMDRDWIYSRVISTMAKNVVDINLPGNAFIQLTNFGLKSAEKSELLFQDDKGRIQTIVSINLFKHVIPNYKDNTFEQNREWLLNHDVPILGYRIPTQSAASIVPLSVVDVLPESVGDTIILPAEFTTLTGSDFDIDKLYAVRYNYSPKGNKLKKIEFIDANTNTKDGLEKLYTAKHRGVINAFDRLNSYVKNELQKLEDYSNDPMVQKLLDRLRIEVPKEITDEEMEEILIEAGSSLKGFNKLKEKFETLPTLEQFMDENRGKSIYELNSVEALENRLIDIYFAVLTNGEHKAETTTPLDSATALIDEAVDFIKENTDIPKLKSLGATTPSYQTDVWNRNMSGKAGIGPFALNNTHHILSQISGLKMRMDLGFGNRSNLEDGVQVSDLSAIYGTDNELISDWLAAFINIHVDNAKDPKAYYLNVNQFTWSMTNLLTRVGSGAEARYFLPQPIIVELAKGASLAPKEGIKKIVSGSRQYKREILKQYKAKAGNAYKELTLTPSEIMNETFLKEQLSAKNKDQMWYAKQLAILDLFYRLSPAADSLNEFVQLSQIDTKNFGNNLVQIRQFQRKVEEFFKTSDRYFFNATDMYDKTFLRSNYDNMILKTLEVFGDKTVTSTPVFNGIIDQLLNIISERAFKDGDSVKNVYRLLYSKITSDFFMSPTGFDMNEEKFHRLFYGDNSIVQILSKIKSATLWPELKNNAFLKILSPSFDPANLEDLQLITVSNNGTNDRWAKQDIITAWEELLTHKSTEVQKFAKGLVMYAFYTSGFNKKVNSFFSFIPTKFLKDSGFNDFFVNKLKEFNRVESAEDFNSIIKDILTNNWDNDDLVPEFTYEALDSKYIYKEPSTPYPKLISIAEFQDNASSFKRFKIGENVASEPVFKPLIKFIDSNNNVTLYEYIGYNTVSNDEQRTTETRGVYRPIQRKGYTKPGYTIYEYGFVTSNLKLNVHPKSVSKDKMTVVNELNAQGMPKYTSLAGFYGYTPVEDIVTVEKTIFRDQNESVIDVETEGMSTEVWLNSLSSEDLETLLAKSGMTREQLIEQNKDLEPSKAVEVLNHLLTC